VLYWENKSLEAIPNKKVGAHSSLQTRDRYRKLVGEVHERRESQGELPGRQWTAIASISPLPFMR
jgi:hypothetical protein